MSMDTDWVEDVKRWCRSGNAAQTGMAHAASDAAVSASLGDDDRATLGYEAANPMVQARHWPDATSGDTLIAR